MNNTHKSHQAAQLRLAADIIEGDLPWEFSHDGIEWKTSREGADPAKYAAHGGYYIRLVPPDPYAGIRAAIASGKFWQHKNNTGTGFHWQIPENSTECSFIFQPEHYRVVDTFEAHGRTWFKHTGDDMPCPPETMVEVLRKDGGIPSPMQASKAGWLLQGMFLKIVGWRVAEPQSEPEKRVPLTAADVLPGTVFKLAEYEAVPWFTPLHVLDSHVCMFDSRRAFDVNWQTLSDDWTMRLPGETQWQPCSKPVSP